MILRNNKRMRSGASLVEMAAVVLVFTMMLFGILEYCRFVFIRQVLANASREGARYAALHTLDATVAADTEAIVRTKVGGLDDHMPGFTVQVYRADASGIKSGSAVDTEFGDYVAVEIDCDFDPIVPVLLLMNNTIHMESKTLMYSEAN